MNTISDTEKISTTSYAHTQSCGEKPMYIYIENRAEYYSPILKKAFKENDIRRNLSIEFKRIIQSQELINLVTSGAIPKYTDITYSPIPQANYYNTFEEKIHKGGIPVLPKGIEVLISNLCSGDVEGIEWLHKAILYKITHLDDVRVPCVVFYGVGGSGKSTFIELMKSILGADNVMGNLRQGELAGSFDTIVGDKLVYEFAEITSFNTNTDRQLLNKLKNIVFAPTITINRKNREQYQAGNFAWFFVTSNSNRPLVFDTGDSGNRRFSCFRSTRRLSSDESNWIYTCLENAQEIANYIAWLQATYPEVVTYKNYPCLENEDKRLLTQNSESEVDELIEAIRTAYPKNHRLPKADFKIFVTNFCRENEYNEQSILRLFKSNNPFILKKGKVEGYINTQHYYELT